MNFAANYITDKNTCKEVVQELFVNLHIKGTLADIRFSVTVYLYNSFSDCLVIMPLKCRQVYVLHRYGYYTLRKTAEILNRPVNTVEKQYRRAIRFIRIRLSGRGVIQRN